MIGHSHPLRAIVLEFLKDNPKNRPSAPKLCDWYEKIEETKESQDSSKIAQVKVHVETGVLVTIGLNQIRLL